MGFSSAQIDRLSCTAAPEDELAAGTESEAIQVALRYAATVTTDPHAVSDADFEELQRHYTAPQIVELTCVVGMCNYLNRFTSALQIDPTGS